MKAQKCFWFSILPNVLFVYELGPFNLNLKFKSPTGAAVTVTRDGGPMSRTWPIRPALRRRPDLLGRDKEHYNGITIALPLAWTLSLMMQFLRHFWTPRTLQWFGRSSTSCSPSCAE